MSDLNSIALIGRVGKEPEFKYFESGACKISFSLAVKHYDKKTEGEVTEWFNIESFNRLGEYISKGKRIALTGQIRAENYEDKEGNKRKKFYILADNLQILTPKDKEET